jgi:hypothetical protein
MCDYANIFGTGGSSDLETKTQNQSATPGETDFSGVLEQNGVPVATTATVGAYLPLAGGTMTGTLNMNSRDITNVDDLSGPTNSRKADNIVSCTGAAVSGNVATFSGATGKVISDSGASLSSYLPLAGGTMSGALNMNLNPIAVNTLDADTTAGLKWGNGTAIGANTSIAVGRNANAASNWSCVIGHSGTALGASSTSVGFGNSGAAVTQVAMLGTDNIAGGQGSIAIGTANNVNARNAVAIGNTLTNATANSVLLGSTEVGQDFVNLRPATTGTGDLGTSGARFKDAHLSGSIVGSSLTTAVNSIASGPASSVLNRIAVFADTTGKLLADGGSTLAQYLLLAGGTMTGALNMGGFGISGASTIDGSGAVSLGASSATSTALGRTGSNTTVNAAALSVSATSTTFDATKANPIARGQQLSLSKCVNTDASTELKNSTTPTTVFTTVSGNLTWAANTTNVGMLIKLTCYFVVTAFGGGGSLAFNLYVDGSSNTGINAPVSAGNWGIFEAWVRVLGSSSILTTSRMTYNNQATQLTGLGPSAIWALTSAHTLDIRAQWSVASASNAVTFYGAFVETINQT